MVWRQLIITEEFQRFFSGYIGLEDICELVNLSTVQRLPSCDLMEKLNCIIKDCKSVFDMVENLLSPLNRNK